MLLVALALSWAPQVEAQVPVTGTASQPDASGAYTVVLDLEDYMPVSVKKGAEWEEHYVYYLPPDLTIRRVRTFFGVAKGDVFEGHLLITANDFYLYTRGPHKENGANYDAWDEELVSYRSAGSGAGINVHALCAPTKPASIWCHVGVILEVAPDAP